MKHFVYILHSLKDYNFYIGYSTNIKKRLTAHNLGLTRSTKSRRPLKLIYFEEFQNKSIALQREHQIKSYKGGEAFKKLIRKSVVPPTAGLRRFES